MTAPSFGQRLRALRLATAAVDLPRPHLAGTRWASDGRLTINGLARLAHVDPSYVRHLELGHRTPTRAVAERLAAAMTCSSFERALLLVAAGYAPTFLLELDDERLELVLSTAMAVAAGDYRPYRSESCP